MEEDQSENTCDVCKISYASDSELKDHVWSLMHHIKIEQRKKGCAHTCSLCLASCENIIEYGKHLNDDRHKNALSRRNKDPNIPDVLDSFGQGDSFGGENLDNITRQYVREPEFREPDPVPNRKQWLRSANQRNRESRGGHARSYSEPEIDLSFQQEFNNDRNKHFGGKSKNWKKKQKKKRYGQPGWQDFEYDDQGGYNSWGPYGRRTGLLGDSPRTGLLGDSPDDWNGPEGNGYWGWGGPASYGQIASQGLYTAFDGSPKPFNAVDAGTEPEWIQDITRSVRDDGRNINSRPSNRRGSFDSSFNGHARSFSEQEQRGRKLTRGPQGRSDGAKYANRPGSNDKSSPDSNSSNDSAGLKRRRDDDIEISGGKLRKGNSNKRIMELPRPLTPGADYTSDSVGNLVEARSNLRHPSLMGERSNRDRMAESLPVRMETSPSRRNVSPSPSRSSDRKSKQVTWASDMVSSTTDIDSDQQSQKHKGTSSGGSKRSSSLDSSLKRNKLPDSTSDKKLGKKSSAVKTKGKNKFANNSPLSQKISPRRSKDEGESVLEKAEKLCKKLRDEREKGKKDKEMKEKQKKMEIHEELNSQIKVLTEKNKANIKGHLESAESKTEKNRNNSGTASEKSRSKLMTKSKNMGVLEQAAISLGIHVPESEEKKQSVSQSVSKAESRSTNAKSKPDIERIRETIESSVRNELTENSGKLTLASSVSSDHGVPKPDANLSPPAFPSPLAKHMLSKQKSDSSGNYDTDHLRKMVKSPRTTKERLQIAEMLRTYAKSQTRLSLPRFNLKMSDLCSGSGDRHDEIAPLNLENMSPDLQLEIANLIEADVKPDITELEKLLDFQSAANETLDMDVLNDLGILAPVKERTPVRSASPGPRSGSPIVFASSFPKQFSSSESAVNKFQTTSVAIRKENESRTFMDTREDGKFDKLSSSQTMNMRSTSPVSREIPTKENNDNRPSLSIEDLAVEVRAPDRNVLSYSQRGLGPSPRSVSIKSGMLGQGTASPSANSRLSESHSNSAELSRFQSSNIKQEKVDTGYEKAEDVGSKSTNSFRADLGQNFNNNKLSSSVIEVGQSNKNIPNRNLSPVRQSLFHSTNLSRNQNEEEIPVKDSAFGVKETMSGVSQVESDKRTALEKVKSILDEAPNMDRVLSYQQGNTVPYSADVCGEQNVEDVLTGKDKMLDGSQGSQTSSVLDQVYNISLQEENVRQELSTVDQKISQLQKLIDEATQQMNKFTEKKETLLKQEDQMRSTRLKLLQDSRSQSSVGSQPETQYQSALSQLTDAQLHNLSNPVFMKFLLSQRNQSDMSSVGGFSNVETGSQFDPDHNRSRSGSRRGSFTSNITEPVSLTADRPLTPRKENSSRDGEEEFLLSQSVDILSGSAPSMRSVSSNRVRDVTEPVSDQTVRDTAKEVQAKDGDWTETGAKNRTAAQSDTPKSFSFINTPIEKAGFVTLDELMSGNSDIGKLLQRSLESGDRNTLPSVESEKLDATEVSKDKIQPDSRTDVSRSISERERRDSVVSVGSDDIVMSGSDIEKRSGKVSMKFMGTIPDSVNYTDFMKQLAFDSKSKSVMYTVVTSPEAVSHLKKFSDSGLGTGSLSSQGLPKPNIGNEGLTSELKDPGYRSEGSLKSNTTGTLTINDADFESQSVKSTYSLGEQIKRFCEGQNPDPETVAVLTPRSLTEGDRALEDVKEDISLSKGGGTCTPPQSPSRKMLQSEVIRHEDSKSNKMHTTGLTHDNHNDSSPTRKKLKTKKERDRKSKRKQKEEFILESSSDNNSVEDEPLTSLKSKMGLRQPSLPEEDLLATGSEDQQKSKTGDQSEQTVKRSLLDEVQLETETPSDSCDDRNKGQTQDDLQRLKVRPEVLESFRSVVKTKLQGGKPTKQSAPVIQYKGPSLSVAAIQVFKGDVYVCYNGSELRRFNLKTGEILKELDCSPYLVQCLHVTSVEEREDILYTGGACKKLMLFKPQKFNLIETYDYDERITCLHENWGRLFIGLSDGVVSVRSMKTDKELNTFQTTNKSIQCLSSTSAGMTKMLCCGCSDKLIYVLDAISGLLLTMLQGHMLPPVCMEIFDDLVVSVAADKSVLVHNVRSGSLEKTIKDHKAMVSQITSDKDYIYTASYDKLIRCYSKKGFKLQRVYYGAGKGMLTSIIYHDEKILTGNREGLVEALPLGSPSSSWTCQCDGCKLDFAIRDHLLHHVLTDHLLPNSRMLQCPWTGCSQWLSTVDGSQKAEEHIMTEHFK